MFYYQFYIPSDDSGVNSSDIQDTSDPEDMEFELTGPDTIAELLVETDEVQQFNSIIEGTEIEAQLEDADAVYTAFVPVDSVLENESLPSEESELTSLLKNHVAEDLITTDQILAVLGERVYISMGGQDFVFSEEEGRLFVNDIEILEVELSAENGLAYLIDGVL